MKQFTDNLPHYFEFLAGASLVVILAQYALVTGAARSGHLVSDLFQIVFYILLGLTVYRGIIQRSRLAWLVVQVMLAALFAFSLLSTVLCAVLAVESGNLWILLFTALLTAVVNGLLMGFLFSLPFSSSGNHP
jgi:hypothetical protein